MFYFDGFFGKKILKSTLLKDFDCFFTTRDFVLTPASRDDLAKEANENRNFLKSKLNCSEIITAKQTHSSNIAIVSKNKTFYDDTDALISNISGSVLLLNFADCVPVILYSKKHNAGAVIHAGWRGVTSEIAKKTVMKMEKELNIEPFELTALIGPSIGKCCFETQEDTFKALIKNVNQTEFYEKKNDRY